jgi:putative salt-induced outer membrane protein
MKKPCVISMAGLLLCAMQLAAAEAPEIPVDHDHADPPALPAGPVWTTHVGAASSSTSGNTNTRNVNLVLDSQRRTETNKVSINAEFVKSSSEVEDAQTNTRRETTTAFRELAAMRYDHNLSERVFAFGGGELSHDRIALIGLRQVYSTGFGYQLLRGEAHNWDVLSGLSYRDDRYIKQGVEINGSLRDELYVYELMLGEESSHRITESIQFQQKLTINRNLGEVQGTRGQLDMGLQVALNRTLSLSMKLQRRYDGMARAPVQRFDTLVFTGINITFGG